MSLDREPDAPVRDGENILIAQDAKVGKPAQEFVRSQCGRWIKQAIARRLDMEAFDDEEALPTLNSE